MKILFPFGFLLAFLFCGCDGGKTAAVDAGNPSNSQYLAKDPGITGEEINYGQGVWYFPSTEAKFANALAKFLSKNQHLEVVAMTGNVVRRNGPKNKPLSDNSFGAETEYGAAIGYFVVFREKVK